MNARTILRSPYFWGFVIGIVTLTLIRPLLRHIPEPPPVLSQLPEFSLVGVDGKPFGSGELRGQVYVANFFFTSCRSICPAIMKGMARLQDGFTQRNITGIRLVSISVDPGYDTPEVLGAYGTEMGVDPLRWTLLTGDPDDVRRLVVDGFKTPMVPGAPEDPAADRHRPHGEARAGGRCGPYPRLLRLERDGIGRGLQPRAARVAAGAGDRGQRVDYAASMERA